MSLRAESGESEQKLTLLQPEDGLEQPRRIPEVELIGPVRGTSDTDKKWLICVGGSQYVHATELLYHVLNRADGHTTVEQIAQQVAAKTGLEISADDVRWLLINRLAPSGLIVLPDASSAVTGAEAKRMAGRDAPLKTATGAQQRVDLPAAPQAQALRIRRPRMLLPSRVTGPLTAVLKYLYWPPLTVAVVLAALAVNVWLYSGSDLLRSVTTLFMHPELVLILLAIDMLRGLWHEIGHASALRWAGCRPGPIGVGLYFAFPVFCTDVTHSYRLNRRQRIRVNLGGIYFDLVLMIVLFAAFWFTGYLPLPLMVALIGIKLLRHFTPFLRFDGYYLIGDLVGTPEPLSTLALRVGTRFPWRRGRATSLPSLRPLTRLMIAPYLMLVVAYLALPLLIMAVAGKEIITLLPQSALHFWSQFRDAWRGQSMTEQLAATLQLALWAIIPLSLALFCSGFVRLIALPVLALLRLGRRRWTQSRPAPAHHRMRTIITSRPRFHWPSRAGRAKADKQIGLARSPAVEPRESRVRTWAWPLVAICVTLVLGLGAAAVAGIVSSRLTRYEATATLSLQPAQGTSLEQAREDLGGDLTNRALVQQVMQELHARGDPVEVLRGITVKPLTSDQVVEVKVKQRDPSFAAALANRLVGSSIALRQAEQQQQVNISLRSLQTSISDLAKQITDQSKTISALEAIPLFSATPAQTAQLDTLRQKNSADSAAYAALVKNYEDIRANQLARFGTVSVVNAATVPEKPLFPNTRLNMLLAGLLGGIAGAGLAYVASIEFASAR